jgi:LysR family transcriptional regulator for metE and metH
MIQMAALGRGVTVLPDWLARQYVSQLAVTTVRLGKRGVMKTLFAAMREGEQSTPYMQQFVELGQQRGITQY